MAPDLVVLMTAYNAEKTIDRAIDSLKSVHEPFDLLIVDDASPLPVAKVVAKTGGNVEIVRCEKNLGVAGAKNFGLRRVLSKGYKFVAMMDADDVCHPARLDRQVAFLRDHPEVALVGTWARYINEDTREVMFHYRPACDPAGIREALYVNSCVLHSSWMLRTQALRVGGLYSDRYQAAEDYELMRRLSSQFDFANLPEFLLDYTLSMSGVSMRKRQRQLWDRLCIQLRYFDPRRLPAWRGVARTLMLFAVPRRLLNAYRGWRWQLRLS